MPHSNALGLDAFYRNLEERCRFPAPPKKWIADIDQEEILMGGVKGVVLTMVEKKATDPILRLRDESRHCVKITVPNGYQRWARMSDDGDVIYIKNGNGMEYFRIQTYNLRGKLVDEKKFWDFQLDAELCPGLKNPESEMGESYDKSWRYNYVSHGWNDLRISGGIIFILAVHSHDGTMSVLALDTKNLRYNQGILGNTSSVKSSLAIIGDSIYLLDGDTVYKTDKSFWRLERHEPLSRLEPGALFVDKKGRFIIPRPGPKETDLGYVGIFDENGNLLTFLGREQRYVGLAPTAGNAMYAKAMITREDGLDTLAREITRTPIRYKAEIHKFLFEG